MDPRDDSGQASIEHLGLMLLVALVLAAAGAISAVAAPGLVNRVTTGMQRGLCVVAAQRCATLDREPCPLQRTDRTLATRVTLGVLRLGDDRALTVERRSDGSYVIALVEGLGAGEVALAGRGSAEASADAVLSIRAGRTWHTTDRASAVALVERLRHRALPAVEHVLHGAADLVGLERAEPGLESYTLSGRAAASAAADLGFGSIISAGVDGEAGAEVGVEVAAHRREATAYIGLDGRIGAFFDALPQGSIPRPGGRRRGGRVDDGERDPLATVLNPAKLQLEGKAFTRGVVALRLAPGPRVLAIELTAIAGTGDAARELRARLDPADPGVAAALAAWRRHPGDAARLAALARAAGAGAAIDERTFVVAGEEREYGGEIGIGAGLGLTAVKGLRTLTLAEQRSRPVGGLWEDRIECAA